MKEKLRLRDVRAAFRLIGDIRAAGSDPAQWRAQLVRGLRDLLNAVLVISSEVHVRPLAGKSKAGLVRVIDIGWGCDGGDDVWQTQTDSEAKPQDFMLTVMPNSDTTTLDLNQDIPVQPTVPLRGGTSYVLSQYPLPHLSAIDQLGIYKDVTDKPFTRAQHRLIRLFHVELGRLWTRDALDRARDPGAELPPRLAQTLAALQSGCSEKEVSARLGISKHTVHNYVKALHQRFGVSSRGELLAKLQPSPNGFLPQFSVR
ncbi:MAG: LuxR family transcriptional regulator [Phycisphaerales bacterium]|nr:LuxR family transcriptional regulator [Phycisphaerales bacterium]